MEKTPNILWGNTSSMVKSVCSARDSVLGSLGGWAIGSSKDSRTKDSGCSCNQRIEIK